MEEEIRHGTVTIGGTEVEIRETEDGFVASEASPASLGSERGGASEEAVEADDEPESGVYLRGESEDSYNTYGFEIPVTADFVIEETGGGYAYDVAFNEEDNVDDELETRGAPSLAREHDFSGHVSVVDIELVEY